MRKSSINVIVKTLCFAVFLSINQGWAQKASVEKVKIHKVETAPWKMGLSYYGNLVTHPGFEFNVEKTLFEKQRSKEKKKGTKTIKKEYLINPSFAFYSHKTSNKNLLLSAEMIRRRQKNDKKSYREYGIGLGYLRKFNTGETWVIKNDGSVKKKKITSSRGYFTPSLTIGTGRRFMIQEKLPITVFSKLNTNLILGYNAGWVPEFSLELGIRTNLNWK